MSTPREELHALIDSMSDKAAADLLPELRLLKLQAEARTERPGAGGSWPPAWFGSVDGTPPDFSEHIDEILGSELGRSSK
ncbi:hypothetical protein GCM10009630_42160 [Kribbella jejuensis]|uniref:Uncharacterized protein n=1 Tax=Kribbella jejuensis TaxID=236068 RepID=A0A542EQE4_9ACTN|nr:hypothetical protein [Kribbella jejuensis]TQJ17563.1 hypothetical protein FB475_1684 [Kribbella jejuensis]